MGVQVRFSTHNGFAIDELSAPNFVSLSTPAWQVAEDYAVILEGMAQLLRQAYPKPETTPPLPRDVNAKLLRENR